MSQTIKFEPISAVPRKMCFHCPQRAEYLMTLPSGKILPICPKCKKLVAIIRITEDGGA